MSVVKFFSQIDWSWINRIDWTAWSSLGAILSAFVALIAVLESRRNSRKTIEIAEKQLEEAKQSREDTKKDIESSRDSKNANVVSVIFRTIRYISHCVDMIDDVDEDDADDLKVCKIAISKMLENQSQLISKYSGNDISTENAYNANEVYIMIWLASNSLIEGVSTRSKADTKEQLKHVGLFACKKIAEMNPKPTDDMCLRIKRYFDFDVHAATPTANASSD